MSIVKRASHFFVYWALKGIAGMTRLLPWRLSVALGGGIGLLFFSLSKRYRTQSIENYKTAFGLDTLDRLSYKNIKKSFKNIGRSLVEILSLEYLNQSQIEDLVLLEGEEYLKDREGKGILLITGHIGNWELLGAILCLKGYPLHAIAAPLYDARLNDWVVRLRARFRVKTINRGTPSSSRKILEILRKKEILALLIDQDTRVNGLFVPFFNKKAYTPTGAAQLMLRFNPQTVMAFMTRLPDNRHRLTIQKPVSLPRTGDASLDIETYTAYFTSCIEDQIRAHPDQWVWMHRRWKTKEIKEVP